MENRIRLRKYFRELLLNQKKLFESFMAEGAKDEEGSKLTI